MTEELVGEAFYGGDIGLCERDLVLEGREVLLHLADRILAFFDEASELVPGVLDFELESARVMMIEGELSAGVCDGGLCGRFGKVEERHGDVGEGEREREKRKRLKRGLLKARTPEPHVRPHLAQFNSLTTSHVPRPHPAAPLKRPSPALRLSPANPTPSQPPRRAHLILFPYQNTEHPHSSVLIQAKLAPPARSTVP